MSNIRPLKGKKRVTKMCNISTALKIFDNFRFQNFYFLRYKLGQVNRRFYKRNVQKNKHCSYVYLYILWYENSLFQFTYAPLYKFYLR